jgi:hypothetical protein
MLYSSMFDFSRRKLNNFSHVLFISFFLSIASMIHFCYQHGRGLAKSSDNEFEHNRKQ